LDGSRFIEIEGIGQVFFEHSKRARNLNISVKPFKDIRVAVPDGLTFNKALEFVNSRYEWIRKSQEKMKRHESEFNQHADKVVDIDRGKAKRKLKARLNALAKRHGFTYNKVYIRNQKMRWGSCSPTNNISLNIRLVRLPEDLLDYVLLHELVHTRKKNHGVEFWAELNKLVGNGKAIAAKLRQYSIGAL